MSERIYCGNGKEKKFENGGSIITITVDIDTLIREFPNYGFTTDAGKRKVRLKIGQRREIDQYGNSHLVEVDTWKPSQGGASQSQDRESYVNDRKNSTAPISVNAEGNDGSFADDIPF